MNSEYELLPDHPAHYGEPVCSPSFTRFCQGQQGDQSADGPLCYFFFLLLIGFVSKEEQCEIVKK